MDDAEIGPRPVFKDSKGREWKLELSVGAIEDMREQCGVDLDKCISNPEQLAELILKEPKKLAEMLWILCEDQAKAAGVEPRDFGRALNRAAIDGATDALIGAVVLFFPRASAGRAISEALPEILAKMDRQISVKTREALSNLHTS